MRKGKVEHRRNHFCKNCGKSFCYKCLSFHSKILSDHTVLGRADVIKWKSEEQPEKKSVIEFCGKYGNELETFCEDHKELCCSVCVDDTHRISNIPDIAKGIREKSTFKEF
ncbi:hypothetical protein MAR_034469 [Mya arenaria]|uniref:B box-type domain-containing protein n=1 Tax=Mya arenaria TaxID=6604 RepID=A0ABY7GC01_MYAAR|nr:hypothetical protein MAR_034469 [Mya arenaria]